MDRWFGVASSRLGGPPVTDDLTQRAVCNHSRRTGGNDYLECLECGLMWDYRKETAEQRLIRDLLAALVQAEQRESRIKELARVEHDLCMSIVKHLKEIGEISDAPDTNITGAIHGVIDGYVSWRASAKSAEAQLVQAEQEKAKLQNLVDGLKRGGQATIDAYSQQLTVKHEALAEKIGQLIYAEARLATQEATTQALIRRLELEVERCDKAEDRLKSLEATIQQAVRSILL